MPRGVYQRKNYTEKGRIPCSECGQVFMPHYLQTHRRRQHGIYGGTSGRIRKNKKVMATEKTVEIAQAVFTNNKRRFRHEENFVVLSADDGSIWVAERVR